MLKTTWCRAFGGQLFDRRNFMKSREREQIDLENEVDLSQYNMTVMPQRESGMRTGCFHMNMNTFNSHDEQSLFCSSGGNWLPENISGESCPESRTEGVWSNLNIPL